MVPRKAQALSLSQLHLRRHHLRDGSAGRGHWGRHHTSVPQEDRARRPAGVCRQHAWIGHLHLPHLRGGQEEHRRSLRKGPFGVGGCGCVSPVESNENGRDGMTVGPRDVFYRFNN